MRIARSALLSLTGDVLLLIGFAAAGRVSHDERHGNAFVEATAVAAPFIAGWLIAAPLFGTFSPASVHDRARALRRVPAAWLVGGCLGLVLRSLIQNRPIPLAFDAIALGFNLVTVTAWRVVLAALTERS